MLFRSFKWIFLTYSTKRWVEGFGAIPILALGNIFLGIYYNLSIWYKLTNKNMYGAWITIGGAIITIVLNMLLIPRWHYYGAAFATFCCYLYMMVNSYRAGQRYYPVPYPTKKLISYIVLVVLIYLLHLGITSIFGPLWFSIITGLILFVLFTRFVMKVEAKELQRFSLFRK